MKVGVSFSTKVKVKMSGLVQGDMMSGSHLVMWANAVHGFERAWTNNSYRPAWIILVVVCVLNIEHSVRVDKSPDHGHRTHRTDLSPDIIDLSRNILVDLLSRTCCRRAKVASAPSSVSGGGIETIPLPAMSRAEKMPRMIGAVCALVVLLSLFIYLLLFIFFLIQSVCLYDQK